MGIHSLREGASRSAAAVRTAEYGGNGLAWLRDRDALNVILDGSHTALVDPPLLCRIILESCISCGLRLHQPVRPISFARSSSGATSSVEIIYTSTQDTKTLSCTNFVFAAGTWVPEVHRLLFPGSNVKTLVTAIAGHSLLVQSPIHRRQSSSRRRTTTR